MKLKLSLLVLGIGLISVSSHAAIPVQASVGNQSTPSLASVLAKVMPTVVNVMVIGETPASYPMQDNSGNPGQNDHNNNQQQENSGNNPGTDAPPAPEPPQGPPGPSQRFGEMGSGVIVKTEGDKAYIVTNAHVVRDAKLITITLSDGRRFKARLIGADQMSDLAVLQINATKLTVAQWGDSDKLQVGDYVAAIGNPFGLHQTATSGVVSALHRSDLGIEGYENFIQTDASINPGNSGGALVNLQGELVGINTALIGPIGGNVGIGLSIPSNMVRDVVAQILHYGKVNRGVLGVMVQELTPALADAFNISGKKGALITNITAGSPADKAGLKSQDVVIRINQTDITSGAQLRNILGLLPIDTKVALLVLRKDKTLTLQATIVSPKALKMQTEPPAVASFLDGVRLTSYDELIPDFGAVKGVGVLDVDETSDAWISGLRTGDVILAANGQSINNLDELLHLAKGDSKRLLLKIGRGPGIIFLVINNYN